MVMQPTVILYRNISECPMIISSEFLVQLWKTALPQVVRAHGAERILVQVTWGLQIKTEVH